MLVEVEDLRRSFRQHRRLFQRRTQDTVVALDGIDLTLNPGECLAIVGPNGAGKSTLLKILTTIISPTGGRATVGGFDVSSAPGEVRRQVGYVGDADRSFFWPLTGEENLVFFGQLAGLSRSDSIRQSRHWIARVGLAVSAGARVSGYSAGMRQRLALARSMMHRPAVLLLDEPTSNLDAAFRSVAVGLINDIVGDGCGAIVATHDPGLVSATATRTLRLEGGRVAHRSKPVAPVQYSVSLSTTQATDPAERIIVNDLGDGHALTSALYEAVQDGRDVLAVERDPAGP